MINKGESGSVHHKTFTATKVCLRTVPRVPRLFVWGHFVKIGLYSFKLCCQALLASSFGGVSSWSGTILSAPPHLISIYSRGPKHNYKQRWGEMLPFWQIRLIFSLQQFLFGSEIKINATTLLPHPAPYLP